MANLYQWQKISRVVSGLPFGNGADGTYNSATIPTITYKSCSGTANSSTLTLGASGFSNGDILLIHQSRGTGIGQWEINRVFTGGGTSSLKLQAPLKYTFTDSGASQAQAVKIPMYSNCTVQFGTWTTSAWNGDIGGILPIAVKGTLTIGGTVTAAGNSVSAPQVLNTGQGTALGGTGGGFRGGGADQVNVDNYAQSQKGEGSAGDVAGGYTNNGNGGGGGRYNGGSSPGSTGASGAGYSNGGDGFSPDNGQPVGGVAFLTDPYGNTLGFGGGGGGGCKEGGSASGGASGGGIIFLMANNIICNATITVRGGQYHQTANQPGGNGGGGNILVACRTASLGSDKLLALGYVGGYRVPAGGDGFITVHHSGTITGTTSPSFIDVSDGTLVENIGGYMM